jgi:hypothetical protein
VYLVTTGTPALTSEFCKRFDVGHACLVDHPGEPGYAAFGLAKVGMRTLLGPSLWQSLKTIARRWREIHAPEGGDPFQMSGTFVFDGRGRLRLAHRSAHPNDHAAHEDIWHCLDSIARGPAGAASTSGTR